MGLKQAMVPKAYLKPHTYLLLTPGRASKSKPMCYASQAPRAYCSFCPWPRDTSSGQRGHQEKQSLEEVSQGFFFLLFFISWFPFITTPPLPKGFLVTSSTCFNSLNLSGTTQEHPPRRWADAVEGNAFLQITGFSSHESMCKNQSTFTGQVTIIFQYDIG